MGVGAPSWSNWWTHLREYPAQFVPIVENLGYGEHVGFVRPLKKFKPKEVEDRSVGEHLLEYDSNANQKALNIPYAVINPDFECEVNQLKNLTAQNLMSKPDLPKVVLEKTFEFTLKCMEYFGVYSKDISIGEVQYNPKGSCGYGMNKTFNSKGDFVKHGYLQDEYEIWRQEAHLKNWFVPYIATGKKEILPLKKVRERNSRMFMFPHAYHFFSSAQDCQYFNKKLYEMDWLIAVGSRYQYGGFHTMLVKFFKNFSIYAMGDVSKWDKNTLIWLLRMCRKVRTHMYRGHDDQYFARMRYMYRQDSYIFLILSNGQVIKIYGGTMSGKCNTTSDNCLIHLFILISLVVYYIDPPSFYDVLNILGGLIYSDDNLLGFNKYSHFLTPFEIRSEFYRRYLLTLKLEDDRVQDTLVGLTFLGAEITTDRGFYVPRYKEDRLWAGIFFKNTGLTPNQLYAKVLALYALGAYCSVKYTNYCYQYLICLHKKTRGKIDFSLIWDDDLAGSLDEMPVVLIAKYVPTVQEVRDFFWLNLESSSAWLPDDVEPKYVRIIPYRLDF